jgi:glycosyltransferase involved in cell wall biosynthesis
MKHSTRPPVTVVVPTRDRPELLRACLAAVAPLLGPQDQLLVVDSASTDASGTAAVVAEVPRAELIREDVAGASRARNAGWRQARHDVVVFTDDDCLPAPGWLDAFGSALEDDTSFAWGQVTVPAGRAGIAEHGEDGPDRAVRGTDVGTLGPSCNLAVRRSALEAVGGFDEVLGPGTPLRAAEDRDLQLRLLETGGTGVYVPEALVEHDPWRPRSALVRLHRDYGVGNGAVAVKLELRGLPVRTRFANGLARTHLRAALRAARHRYKAGVVYGLARAVGVVQGRRAARGLSLRDGHLQD